MSAVVHSLSTFLFSLLPSQQQQQQQLHFHNKTPQQQSKWTPLLITPNNNNNNNNNMMYPSLANANILHFKSTFNTQIKVGENEEDEDSIVMRFRRAVIKAGVLQESKRRRFFETNQDARKRKSRNAARIRSRLNRNWRPPPKDRKSKQEAVKKPKPQKNMDDEDDNWELPEGDIPYCR